MSKEITKYILAVMTVLLFFTGGAIAQADDPTPLEKIEQTPDQILLDTDADREGTVRIINNKFQQKRFNPGSTNKYRFTVDNQSEQQIDIQLNAQVQTPSSDIPIQIITPNNGTFQEKTLQPSEQESYIVEFQAIQTEIENPREVLFTLSENNTNTQTVHNLALTTESGTSSTQTIEPTGERQQLATTVDRFNDSTESERANKSSGIPPIAPDGNDNSIGQIYNFERLLDTNTQNSTKLYPQTDQLNVGFEFSNIPSNNYYTLQTRHLINHTSDIPTYAEVRLVGATGEEIDKDTTYYIGSQHSNTTSFNTQYIQLSEEEAEYVRNNGRLYTVFHHPEEKRDNTGEYISRVSRNPTDLQTGTSGTQYNGTQIDLQVFDLLSSQNPLTYTNSQLNTKDITLKTSEGTILSSPGEFDRGDQIRVEFTVENTGSSVISNQQVYLLENQQSVKNKSITLNPGEEGTITFYLNKFISGEYTYTTPELDDTVTAVVDTKASLTPADAEITPISGVQEVNDRYIVEDTGTTAELTASDTISDSPIQSYQWTLEDETMTETQNGESFSYTFAQKGQYSLELAVETEETTSYTNVTLNVATLPPEAEVGDDIIVSPGEEIRFNGTGSSHPLESGTIDTYRWDFGDGNSREGSSVTYSYSEEGTYEAQLTVVDENGNNDIATRTITVEGQKPVAKFTTSPDEPVAEIDDVVFNASESFDPTGQGLTQYQWDFGDGETTSSEIPTVEHTYSEPGEYEVRLTVSNLTRTETITKTVTIQDKPFDATITGNKEVSWGTLASYNMYNSPDPDELIENVEWTLYEGHGEDRTQIQTFEKREFTYEFEDLGDYSLDLYVEGGRFEDSESIDITVNTGPPRAVTVEEEDEIFISQTINFQGQDSYHPLSQVDIANYRWWYDRDGDTQVISDGGGRGNANAVDYRFEVPTQNYTAEDPRTPDPVSLRDPYDVQLEVTDTNSGTDSADVEVEVVNRGPRVDFPFDKLELWISNPLQLGNDIVSHPESPYVEITDYDWTIEDSNGNVVHTSNAETINGYSFYPDNGLGTYTVSLEVEDEFGAKASDSFEVDVDARDPVPQFEYQAVPGVGSEAVDDTVDYTDESTHNEPVGDIVEWEWDWDDGSSDTYNSSTNPRHQFNYNLADGVETFNVTLTVTDEFGQTESLTRDVPIKSFNSCLDVLNTRESYGFDPGSGVYYLYDGVKDNVYQTYCDMSYDGGGWTLVTAADTDADNLGWDSSYWTDRNTLNAGTHNPLNGTNSAHKYESFYSTPAVNNEVRLENTNPSKDIVFNTNRGLSEFETAYELFKEGGEQRTYPDPINHPDIDSTMPYSTTNGGVLGINVEANKNPEVNIIFAVDVSGSVDDYETDIREDIRDFIDQNPSYYNYGLEEYTYRSNGDWRGGTGNLGNMTQSEFKNNIPLTNDASGSSALYTSESKINSNASADAQNFVFVLGDGDQLGDNKCDDPDINAIDQNNITYVGVLFGANCSQTLVDLSDTGPGGDTLYYNGNNEDFIDAFSAVEDDLVSQGKVRIGLRSKTDTGRFDTSPAYGIGTGFGPAIWDDGSGQKDTDGFIWVR